MARILIMITAILVAGCIEPTSGVPVETPQTPVASRVDNESLPAVPVITVGVDANLTQSDTVQVFANTTAPVDVEIRVDGTSVLREVLSTTGVWNVPLGFGVNDVEVLASAPGFAHTSAITVVRLAETTVEIDYGVFHPGSQGAPRTETFQVWIDVDGRPSAAQYEEQGVAHIDAFTAHDQLVVFELVAGKDVVFEYFPSFQGFGVSRIDGAGSPVSSDAPPWWCYTVNGDAADGISIQPVEPGDVVSWELGSCT